MPADPLQQCRDCIDDISDRFAAGEEVDAQPVHDRIRSLLDMFTAQRGVIPGLRREDLLELIDKLDRLECAIERKYAATEHEQKARP